MRDCYLITSNIKPLVALTTLKATLGLVLISGTKIGISAAVCAESYIYRSTTRLLHVHTAAIQVRVVS